MRKRCTPILFSAALLLTMAISLPAEELTQQQNAERSLNYLILLDGSHYETAWQAMSPLFKLLNEQHQWQRRQQAIRDAYGQVLVRTIDRISYRDAYRNSPDGTYVTIQFDTVFSNKAKAVETIVLDCNDGPDCSVRDYVIN